MKMLITAIAILSSLSAQAVVLELAEKLAGQYEAQGNCSFETATVKNERAGSGDFFVVRLNSPATNTYRSRSINMDNMFTKVRTTRGIQRIVTLDLIRGNSMIAQEKTCLPGWIKCSDFTPAMSATLIDENTMEVLMGDESCTFARTK